MTRLRSLIKEVLSTPPKKKDCNCGCGGCNKKAPIITEGRIKKAISEGLTYHVENKIPLHESVYRIGSEKHFELINEARKLWVRGLIDVSEDDQAILETNLGHFGMYEGEKVPLDMPMVNEEAKMPSQEEVDKFFSITQNEMHYLNSKPVMGQKGDRVRNEIEPWDEYDLSNWNALVRKAKAQGKINEGFYSSPSDLEDSGLNVIPKNEIHFNKLKDALRDSSLYAEENEATSGREGYFFFPEEEDGYDQLEMDIQDLMDENNIQGYIEGVFEESLNEENKPSRINSLIKLVKSAKNPRNLPISFGTTSVAIGGTQYDKGELVDMFNGRELGMDSMDIRKVFYNAQQDAEAIADEINASNSGIEATIGYGYGKRPILYLKKSSLNEGQDKWVVYDTKTKKRLPNAGKIYKDRKAAQAFADKQENAKVASDTFYFDKIQEKESLEEKKKAKKKKKNPPLNKPKRGGSKAYYVYVRDPKTKKIKKVSFGSGSLRAKIKNKEARNAFAARHNCKNKKDRTKAGYWSCNLPRYADQLGLGSKMNTFW